MATKSHGAEQLPVRTFQSTPPSRVATTGEGHPYIQLDISIHTTLAGGDSQSEFGEKLMLISIHTTLAGGDKRGQKLTHSPPKISIHTTLAGGDHGAHRQSKPVYYFNPHHPRGWRHAGEVEGGGWRYFNPHHPRGWRQQKWTRNSSIFYSY